VHVLHAIRENGRTEDGHAEDMRYAKRSLGRDKQTRQKLREIEDFDIDHVFFARVGKQSRPVRRIGVDLVRDVRTGDAYHFCEGPFWQTSAEYYDLIRRGKIKIPATLQRR